MAGDTPGLTLREDTKSPHAVTLGASLLAGSGRDAWRRNAWMILSGHWKNEALLACGTELPRLELRRLLRNGQNPLGNTLPPSRW